MAHTFCILIPVYNEWILVHTFCTLISNEWILNHTFCILIPNEWIFVYTFCIKETGSKPVFIVIFKTFFKSKRLFC